MKISEKWDISGGSGDMLLTESIVRVDDKTGKEKVTERNSYHPNIEQCLNKIVWVEARNFIDDDLTRTIADLKLFLSDLKLDIKEIAHAAQVAIQTDSQQADATDSA